MQDRDQLVARVEELLRTNFEAGLSGETSSAAAEVVDEVLLPALKDFAEGDERERLFAVVDMTSQSYQAAIQRQRAIINRLQERLAEART